MAISSARTAARPRRPRGAPATPARAAARTDGARRQRVAYLDNLKVLLVAVIIAGHGALGYSDFEYAWPYVELQETQLGAVGNVALMMLLVPAALFAMGLFFLISGLVIPGSMSRKGPRIFARDRLVRLGLPLALWTLVIWPGAIWLARLGAGETHSFWWQVSHSDPFLDAGPMWFVEVLLIYSLAYAAWCGRRRRGATGEDPPPATSGCAPLSGRTLVALAATVSVSTALVRLVFPAASGQIGQSHLWQWPQFVAMFGLGIVAAQRGWLHPVPDGIRRRCGVAALLGIVAFVVLAGTVAATGLEPDVFELRLHWAPLALAAIEGPLAVGASVWLLGLAQRRLDRPPGRFGRALARSAFAAFILQGVVLIGLMLVLRPVEIPAEIKAIAVAVVGVAAAFVLGWLLVTRTRLGRVL